MNISEQKSLARKAGFANRKAAHDVRGDSAARASEHLLEYIAGVGKGLVISAYMPIRTEIDTLPAMKTLHDLGHRICVPVIEGKGKPLTFKEWTPTSEMVDGPFGAYVPAAGETLSPELLIVPLVSFDAKGYRMGYGGGFYDRTLELLRARRKTFAVGYAYAGQLAVDLPIEETDQPLDAVVTEEGVTRF